MYLSYMKSLFNISLHPIMSPPSVPAPPRLYIYSNPIPSPILVNVPLQDVFNVIGFGLVASRNNGSIHVSFLSLSAA